MKRFFTPECPHDKHFVNKTASRLFGFEHPSTQRRYSYASKAKTRTEPQRSADLARRRARCVQCLSSIMACTCILYPLETLKHGELGNSSNRKTRLQRHEDISLFGVYMCSGIQQCP